MRPLTRVPLLVAVVTAALPFTAAPVYAATATTSHLTSVEYAAELATAVTATKKAAAAGWSAAVRQKIGTVSFTEHDRADLTTGRVYFEHQPSSGALQKEIVVAGKGVYESITATSDKAALKLLKKSAVKYRYTADPSVTVDSAGAASGYGPFQLLSDSYDLEATKTVNADASVDYAVSVSKTTKWVMHLSAKGVFTSFSSTGSIESRKFTVNATYSYGRQTVAVPAAKVTITKKALDLAEGYGEGPDEVQAIAVGCRDAVGNETNGKPTVAALRKLVRDAVAEQNTVYGGPVLKATDISGGVRISTTNPWTHKTVKYTVKIVGNKAIAVRG